MKARSTAKPEQSHHHGSSDRGGHGRAQQATAVADSRPEMEQQQGLLILMAGSPRVQRKCACGNRAGATESCTECLQKKALPLQTKLRINEPGDKYEQEADRIADQVMRMPEPSVQRQMEPEKDEEEGMVQRKIADQITPLVQRQVLPGMEEEKEEVIQTKAAGNHAAASAPIQESSEAPPTVQEVLRAPGQPLDPVTRAFMEPRFGHDFSRVRVHSDAASGKSARHVNAFAYAFGHDIVFGAGRFAPDTVEGRRLLAHELTHVLQQTRGDGSDPVITIQREVAKSNQLPAPKDLIEQYEDVLDQNFFEKFASRLVDAVYLRRYDYVTEVFEALQEDYEDEDDNVGAEFVKQLPESKLNEVASTKDGRLALTVVYEAIITGKVTPFEREQANKVLIAKARANKPEDYVELSKFRDREKGMRTRIFPVRFMRVFGGAYAPPLATLMPNGNIRVRYYPSHVRHEPMFKPQTDTLGGGFFAGDGMEINPNEIVGIKDYEAGGGVLYLPAMALIDYSNQSIRSTGGKILDVSLFAATMGIGGGAVAGVRSAAAEVTSATRWGMRLGKVASALDRVENFIEIASFVINEHRDWIISEFGDAGKRLVQTADIANSVAGIYGLGRLAQGGYKIVKEMQSASKSIREKAEGLIGERAKVVKRIDEETDAMIKQLDDEAAKNSRAAAPPPAEKPTVSPGGPATKAPTKAETSGPRQPPGKPVGAVDAITASAQKIGISSKQLKLEVSDLRKQTANPGNVRRPAADPKLDLDAEMSGSGHEFSRRKSDRTWCRASEPKYCELDLDPELDADVDRALARNKAKFEAITQQRKVREAAAPRQTPQQPTGAPKIRSYLPMYKLSEKDTGKILKSHFPAHDWKQHPLYFERMPAKKNRGKNPHLSTEPDWYSKSQEVAAEVKTKDFVSRRQSVDWDEITLQLEQRIHAMPAGTKNWIIFDIRGQPLGTIEQIASRLSPKWNAVFFITDNGLAQLTP